MSAPAFYVFNADSGHGFVVVSADDHTRPVLAYADSGSFPVDSLPGNLRAWMGTYQQQIQYLVATAAKRAGAQGTPTEPAAQESLTTGAPTVGAAHPLGHPSSHPLGLPRLGEGPFASAPASSTPHSSLLTPNSSNSSRSPVSPLLTSRWNQGEPFNEYCPILLGYGKAVTGCVATAMAQTLYYHRAESVTATTATIPGYDYDANGYSLRLSDIDKGETIDWDNMLDDYSGEIAFWKKAAVANLMLLCGQAVKTSYNTAANGGSSASMLLIPNALRDYFGYDKSTTFVERDYYSASSWDNLVYGELSHGRPVIYGGLTSTDGAHCFVVDGADGNGYYHVNWGWGGSCDGYYLLSVMTPADEDSVVEGLDDGFQYHQQAIINAEPNHGGKAVTFPLAITDVAADGAMLTFNAVNVSDHRASYTYAFGYADHDGTFRLATSGSNSVTLDSYFRLSASLSVDRLSPGTYHLFPACRIGALGGWMTCWDDTATHYVLAVVGEDNSVRLTVVEEGSGATAIRPATTAATSTVRQGVYALDGRCVSRGQNGEEAQTLGSLPRGVYIVNGKKYVKKK